MGDSKPRIVDAFQTTILAHLANVVKKDLQAAYAQVLLTPGRLVLPGRSMDALGITMFVGALMSNSCVWIRDSFAIGKNLAIGADAHIPYYRV